MYIWHKYIWLHHLSCNFYKLCSSIFASCCHGNRAKNHHSITKVAMDCKCVRNDAKCSRNNSNFSFPEQKITFWSNLSQYHRGDFPPPHKLIVRAETNNIFSRNRIFLWALSKNVCRTLSLSPAFRISVNFWMHLSDSLMKFNYNSENWSFCESFIKSW